MDRAEIEKAIDEAIEDGKTIAAWHLFATSGVGGKAVPTTRGSDRQRPPRSASSLRSRDLLSWSVPVARVGGVTVRAPRAAGDHRRGADSAAWHVSDDTFGMRRGGHRLPGSLLVVTLHELITAWVNRRLGGGMTEVVLQPLGLDEGTPPAGWRKAVVSVPIDRRWC